MSTTNTSTTTKPTTFSPTQHPDLISAGNGGKILFSTDDFFAVCECMISDGEALWNPSTYTAEGKEMDGILMSCLMNGTVSLAHH